MDIKNDTKDERHSQTDPTPEEKKIESIIEDKNTENEGIGRTTEEKKIELNIEDNSIDNDEIDASLSGHNFHQDAKESYDEEENLALDPRPLDFNVNISVYDKKSKISVEDYLCERFLQVLKDGDFVVI